MWGEDHRRPHIDEAGDQHVAGFAPGGRVPQPRSTVAAAGCPTSRPDQCLRRRRVYPSGPHSPRATITRTGPYRPGYATPRGDGALPVQPPTTKPPLPLS